MVQALGPGDPGAVGKYRLVGRLGRGGMGWDRYTSVSRPEGGWSR
jgi:hypothetical protein